MSIMMLNSQSMSHTRISAVIKTASFNIMPSLSPPKAPVSGSSPRKPPVEDQGKYCWQWQVESEFLYRYTLYKMCVYTNRTIRASGVRIQKIT